MRLAPALGLALALALTGCLEERIAVDLRSDGRGKLVLERVLSNRLTGLEPGQQRPGPEAHEAARMLAAQALAAWSGVAAWTDVSADVAPDGRIAIRGTAWFEDLAAVQAHEADGRAGPRFELRREGEVVVEVRVADATEQAISSERRSLFDASVEELAEARTSVGPMLEQMLEGYSSELAVTLPAAPQAVTGWTAREGARVSLRRGARDVAALVESVFALVEEIRPRVAGHELTRRQAEAELVARLADATRCTARLAAAPAAGGDAFAAELARARQAWEASEWRELVSTVGRVPEPGADLPPDAFEPNDHQDEPAALAPGSYPGLTLNHHDWYRVEVPAGKELRVDLTFVHDEGDVDVELCDLAGERLMASLGVTDREELRFPARDAVVVLVHVYNAASSYGMVVGLGDFTPADRFEPNDTPSQASPIEPGTYTDLVCTGEDYYLLQPARLSELTVRAVPTEPGVDLELTVSTRAGRHLGSSMSFGDDPEAVTCYAPAEPVLVRVHEGRGRYRLEVERRDGPAPSPFEENDAREQARPLQPGTYAEVFLDGEDWYRLTVPPGHELRVSASFSHARGDVDLALHDAAGRQVRSSLGTDDSERIVLHPAGAAAATYDLRVYNAFNVYSLTIETPEYRPADAFEPNERAEEARPLRPGDHGDLFCTGEDWYRLDLEAGQIATVRLAFLHADGDIDLQLLDARQGVLASSLGTDDAELATCQVPPDGVVLVRVHHAEGAYTLHAGVSAASPFEPNDRWDQAASLEPGTYEDVLLSGEDWFAIAVPEGRDVRVHAAFSHDQGDLDVALYDDRGAELARSIGTTDEESLEASPGRATTVFLRVFNTTNVLYTLTVELPAAEAPSPFEPNETRATATRLTVPASHERVRCSGEDWYRVDAEPGAVLVAAIVLGERDALRLEVTDAAGAVVDAPVLTTSLGPGQVRFATAATAPPSGALFVHVSGGRARYALLLSLREASPFEENDGRAAARPLAPGTYADVFLDGEDWYRLDVPAGKTLRVRLEFSHALGDVDAILYDAGDLALASSTGVTDTESLELGVRTAQTTFLRVYNALNTYTLRVELADLAPAGPLEPNDAPDQAPVVAPGTYEGLACNGSDWFRIEVPRGKELEVAIDFRHRGGDLDLQLFDAARTTVETSLGVGDREVVTHLVPAGGTFYARVFNARNAYSLTVTLRDGPGEDPFEPNDTRDQARPLAAGTYPRLLLDDEDWYAITIPAGQEARITLQFEHRRGDVDAELHGASGDVLRRSVGMTDRERITYAAGAAEARVLLRVYNTTSVYDLGLELGEHRPADRFEPNETRAEASPLVPGTYPDLVCTGEDWYRLDLRAGQRLQVRLELRHRDGDVDLAVIDARGRALAESTGTGDQEAVTVTAQTAGTYYVRVYLAENAYSMTVTVRD